MHVHTATSIAPDEIKARFEAAATAGAGNAERARRLVYAKGRKPPKFFLTSVPVTLPAAAEVAITERPGGADVVLRLMWGPLPAPFPRALAAAGILLGPLVAYFSQGSAGDWTMAAIIALLPLAALLYQKTGERNLQSQLGELLGGASFLPKPH
jgi:hypothetical protein